VFGAAADELAAEFTIGEHLWTADNGDRAYARRDGEDSGPGRSQRRADHADDHVIP
jgi:hypothetical protein